MILKDFHQWSNILSVYILVFVQNAWTALDGSATSREFLLMALADLDAILIRATFTRDTDEARYNFISKKKSAF